MEYLYVCHFSNGHIKVGRSINPESRIATHADRVACIGVELVEHHIVECVSFSAPAESELIERCTENAVMRNKNEWFVGLDYPDVCEWANEYAIKVRPDAFSGGSMTTVDVIRYFGTQMKAAKALGLNQSSISIWGEYPPDARQLQIERITLGALKAEPGCLDRVLGMDKLKAAV